MRRVPVILVAVLATAGCSAQAARDPAPPPAASAAAPSSATPNADLARVNESEWRFVELDGAPVPAGIHATLQLKNGRASGKAGCNAYGARYHIAADGTATFTQTLSTKMACLQPAGVMRVEQGVFNAFRNTATVAIVNGELVMLDASDKPLAKLQKQTIP